MEQSEEERKIEAKFYRDKFVLEAGGEPNLKLPRNKSIALTIAGVSEENYDKIIGAEEPEESMINPNEINWVDEEDINTWEDVKLKSKMIMGSGRNFSEFDNNDIFFQSHSKDTVIGKPQLAEPVKQRIPLVKLVIKKTTEGKGKDKTDIEIKKIFLVDERFDKRYDGYLKDSLALDFWIYKIVSGDKEHFILSQKQLPNEVCNIKGMSIELDDFTEMSKSLRIGSLSRIFILKEFEPNVKVLSKEQMIKFTKTRKITEQDWITFLGYHQFGNVNRFPAEVELLRSSFVLGGKVHGFPNQLLILGMSGTKKSVGHIETLSYKFGDDADIIEGGDSRVKGLIPSFKEKPASVGYLARSNRMGFVDEIGKMIEFESNKHQSTNTNILGEMNFLLEHKLRSVGSGNDNDCKIQATAKFLFATNPVKGKATIYDHVGLVDPTTLSRMIIWVQDDAESSFVMSPDAIQEFPPTPQQDLKTKKNPALDNDNDKKLIAMKNVWGGCMGVGGIWDIMSRDEFLTLFDTCYRFVCDIDDDDVQKLVDTSVMLAREPMKSSVWKPRAFHHVKLLIDGLAKHRCLFKDYDDSFTANQEDYDNAEKILVRMVNGWNTNLLPKDNIQDGFGGRY